MNALLDQVRRHLKTDRRAALAVSIALIANLILAGAYLWSRGGQTTTVEVIVVDNDVLVYVDGTLQTGGLDLSAVPGSGGIVLTLEDTESVPSLPSPRGIDSVRVTDADGTLLFEDKFEGQPSSEWEISGSAVIGGGVIGADGSAQLALPARDWRDYRVEVTYRNVRSAGISVRAGDDLYGIVTKIRPFHWNEDDSKWISMRVGYPGDEAPGLDIRLDRTESMKSLIAMLTRPYPYLLLLGIIAALAVALLLFVPRSLVSEIRSAVPHVSPWLVPSVLVGATLTYLTYLGVAYRENVPFVPDSIAYVFQAKIFASGHLTADPPPVRGAFDFFVPAPFALTDDSWAAQYPFAHPLMLAFGQVLGAPWIIPPILGAASVALIFAVARNVYNQRVAVVAALLLATSPFFVMNATDLMSHNTAGFFLIASLLCLTLMHRRPVLFGLLAGLAFGLLLNTRPLTALALVPTFGIFLLFQAYRSPTRRGGVEQIAAFVAGGALMAVLFLGWNYTITGDALRTGYQATGVTFFDTSPVVSGGQPEAPDTGAAAAVGAGGDHESAIGVQNERMQLALLLLVLHGWPQFIGLMFSLLPFLMGTRKGHDWFFLACATTTTGVWVLYESTGVMYGPRYWYEAMPFLILLAARGADRAADLLASGVAAVRDRDIETVDRPLWASRLVVFGFVGVLVATSVSSWMLGNRTAWRADLVPNRASAMCCVLGLDDRIHELAEEQDLHNALVLVDPCGNNFVCYGSVFWRNNPSLDGDVVYAKDLPARRGEIIAAYPGRSVYLATYLDEPSLHPLPSP